MEDLKTENKDKGAFASVGAQGQYLQPGLTKLEYFTAMAMQGITTKRRGQKGFLFSAEYIAEKSVKIAKETLNQLEKEK